MLSKPQKKFKHEQKRKVKRLQANQTRQTMLAKQSWAITKKDPVKFSEALKKQEERAKKKELKKKENDKNIKLQSKKSKAKRTEKESM